jgi:inhibitor of KinA
MLKYFPSGDSAVIIKAGNEISIEVNRKIREICTGLERAKIPGVTDFIQSYNELMIVFDPVITGYEKLIENVRSFEADTGSAEIISGITWEVPVLYGGEWGPDLEEVAQNARMKNEDVVSLHTGQDYLVYMLGFTPGFCYLGSLDKRIAAARKKEPRLKVLAGSVGIAGNQTGIYSVESPGGWQIIGRTPLRLFDPCGKPEFLFKAGDWIRFCSVSEEEYKNIDEEVNSGKFSVKILKNNG